MKSVTSVSGGKTSAYMAFHYPTDYYIFSVVLTDHAPSAPKDSGLLREAQARIPGFIATHEADQTLANVLRLEQELGKPIQWVAAEYSLDRFVSQQTDLPNYRSGGPMLPNKQLRFCTIQQKIMPIFWHLWRYWWDGDPVLMNIGFRWDEPRRVEGWNCDNDKVKAPVACGLTPDKRWQYTTVEWRVPQFPLYDDRISHNTIRQFWNRKGWVFPEISNCRFCFHHTAVQLQRQAVLEPENLQWWLAQEERVGASFGTRPLAEILRQPVLDVFDDNRQSCFCGD
jgi:hypothetical protein